MANTNYITLDMLRITHYGRQKHLVDSYGEEAAKVFYWSVTFAETPPGTRGCPAGSGATELAAVRDLIQRTNAESQNNCVLRIGSEIPLRHAGYRERVFAKSILAEQRKLDHWSDILEESTYDTENDIVAIRLPDETFAVEVSREGTESVRVLLENDSDDADVGIDVSV